jgi:hypothetical protein
MKFNRTHIRKLITDPYNTPIKYVKRSICETKRQIVTTFKEIIFENIFELKFKYIGDEIIIKQNEAIPNIVFGGGSGISYDKRFGDGYIHYSFETFAVQKTVLNAALYFKPKQNFVTVTLDMREGQDKLYFKINGSPLKYVIANISHTKKQISVLNWGLRRMTIISLMFLKNPPINFNERYIYINSFDGSNI